MKKLYKLRIQYLRRAAAREAGRLDSLLADNDTADFGAVRRITDRIHRMLSEATDLQRALTRPSVLIGLDPEPEATWRA